MPTNLDVLGQEIKFGLKPNNLHHQNLKKYTEIPKYFI